jgi:hypothetical protein
MKFRLVPPDPGTGWSVTYHSENDVWSFGIWPVMFGFRVRACRVGARAAVIDYCAADQPAFLIQLLLTVQLALEQLPEDLTENELQRLMPTWQRRPINFDPCWPQLQELAIPGRALVALQRLRTPDPSPASIQ